MVLTKMTSSSSSSCTLPHLLVFITLVIVSFSCTTTLSQAPPAPSALIFPIRKDLTTLQYYTTIEVSSRGNFVNAVIDLASEFLWFDCDSYSLPTYLPVGCGSSSCEIAGGLGCVGCNRPAKPGCSNDTCGAGDYSPFSGVLVSEGFGQDFFYGTSTDGRRHLKKYESIYRLIFSCSDYKPLYQGLARQAKGMVGLSRKSIALPTQFASGFRVAQKFSLCIPSSIQSGPGSIVLGGGPYYVPPKSTYDVTKSLITTPLLINPNSTAPAYSVGDPSDEYFLDVKSIKIENQPISFRSALLSFDKDGVGGTKLSTKDAYTVLHSSIFKPFVRAFEKAASNKKIRKASPVAPFESCFHSNTITKSKLTGPDVPIIDIVLDGKNAEWKIYGANSMVVEAAKGVTCLAFVDGGKSPRTAIVLGGHQLENHFIEFDLAASKLGFSTSLLLQNTTCSQTRV